MSEEQLTALVESTKARGLEHVCGWIVSEDDLRVLAQDAYTMGRTDATLSPETKS